MKIKLTLLLVLCISVQLVGQNESKKAERIRIKNKISEQLTYEIDINTNDSILTDQNFYNQNGKLIKDLRFDEKGGIRYSYLVEYDTKNQMIKQTGYNELGEVSTILTYKYDSNGNRTDYFQHKPDGTLLNHQKRTYKKNLNTELHNNLKNGHGYYRRSKYFYNPEGQYVKIKSYNPKGRLTRISEFEYDNFGNRHKVFDIKNGKKVLSTQYTYDNKNNLITRRFISSGRRIEYSYDDEDNLIEEKTFERGVLTKKTKFFYKKTTA